MYMRNNNGSSMDHCALPWSVVFDWIGYYELLYTDVCCLNNYGLIVIAIF